MWKFCASLALCGLIAFPALAESRFAPPVQATVLEGWVRDDGSRVVGLSLRLAPGWKTYWRAPGDAGIPPRFDWSGTRNIKSVAIDWPTPKVFDQNGMRSVGYDGTLVIPVVLQPSESGAPVRLHSRMELGVCSDVCLPHEVEFEAVLDGESTQPTPAIAAALAQRPLSAAEAGVTDAQCRIRPTKDGLEIETHVSMPTAGAPEYVVIEPAARDLWVSEARTERKGGAVISRSEMININGGPIALDRSAIRITVLGSKHAVDIRGCTPG